MFHNKYYFDKQQIFSVRRHLQRWRGCPGPQVPNHSEQSQHLEGENHLVIFPPPLVPRPPSTGGDIWWWLQNSSNKKSHSPEFENDYSLCLRGKILWSWTSKLCRLSLVSGIINIGHNKLAFLWGEAQLCLPNVCLEKKLPTVSQTQSCPKVTYSYPRA